MVDVKKIKEMREAAELTTTEFAEKICVSQSFVSYMEVGRKQPSVETLAAIANFFGVPMDSLLINSNKC